ncbi:MAG: hypothetical protein HZB51_29060 [Chloroflexi bacterium]|nr:hypothetical protein [Chloroflexota bacterium]
MSSQPPQETDLAKELRELGEQIKRALHVAREHPKTKEFESQVTKAISDLEVEIQRAVKGASEHDAAKKAGEHVKQTAHSIKESGAPDDILQGITKGVQALNDQIRKAIDDAETTTKS